MPSCPSKENRDLYYSSEIEHLTLYSYPNPQRGNTTMASINIALSQETEISKEVVLGRLSDYTSRVRKALYVSDELRALFDEGDASKKLEIHTFADIDEHTKAYRGYRDEHVVIGIFLDQDFAASEAGPWAEFFVGLVYQSSQWDYHVTLRSKEMFEQLYRILKNRSGIHFNTPPTEPVQEEPEMPESMGWKYHMGQPRPATPFTTMNTGKPTLVEYTSGSFKDYIDELIKSRFRTFPHTNTFHASVLVFCSAESRHRFHNRLSTENMLYLTCLTWVEWVDRLRNRGPGAGWSVPKNETAYMMDSDLPDPVDALKAMQLPSHRYPHSVVRYNRVATRHPSIHVIFGHHEIISLRPQEEMATMADLDMGTDDKTAADKRHDFIYDTFINSAGENEQYEEWVLDHPSVVAEARDRFPDPVPVTRAQMVVYVGGLQTTVPIEIHGVEQDSNVLTGEEYRNHVTLTFFDQTHTIKIPLRQDFGGRDITLEKIRIDINPNGDDAPTGTYHLTVGDRSLVVRFC